MCPPVTGRRRRPPTPRPRDEARRISRCTSQITAHLIWLTGPILQLAASMHGRSCATPALPPLPIILPALAPRRACESPTTRSILGGGTRRRHFANPRRLRSTTSCCEDQRKHQTDASQAGSHSSTHLSHTTGRDRSRSTRVAAAAFPAAARLASLFKTTPPEPPRLTRHHGAPPRWTRRGQQALVAPAGALDKLLQQRTC